ncbi:hypothetical protein SH2C18_44480 [Clostridium sediminicola]|uniref:DUF5107 domain-containing protein n=1 Tax=Clostridium sediminicola TaxID=3114879 RepID=UPI0031F26E37
MIKEIKFKGCSGILLENENLKAIVLPFLGGKIASLYHKKKEFELLFQNKDNSYKKPEIYSDFSKFDAAGFDDAFPSINIGQVNYSGSLINYPDHGEIWSAEFNCVIENEIVILNYKSVILPYIYQKIISLKDDRLIIKYTILNNGKETIPCFWTMHCLINCEKDMEIIFPEGTNEIENAMDSNNLGAEGSIHPYPVVKTDKGTEFYLNKVIETESKNCEKFYVKGKVRGNSCGAYYPSKNITYKVEYDKEILPYLGFWVTEGGFRGDYNCALEPSNGYYDSIEIAKKNNAFYSLKPNEPLEFEIKVQLK